MRQNKLTIGKEQLVNALRDHGYNREVSAEIVGIVLEKISSGLLSGKAVNISGTCILTPNFKQAGMKSVAGKKKHIERTISVSAKTSKSLVAAYRSSKKIVTEVTQVRAVGNLFAK